MRKHQVGANDQEGEAGSVCCKAEQDAKSKLEESMSGSIKYRAKLRSKDPDKGVGTVGVASLM